MRPGGERAALMAGPVGSDAIRSVAEAAFDLAGADGVEVLVMHDWGGLTRFASSAIHQSTWREDTAVRVRVVAGDRVGVAATNDLSMAGARAAAASALEIARMAPPDPMFPGLAPPADVASREAFDEETASASPARRAEAVAALVTETRAHPSLLAAGAFETTASEVAVANTEGQFCYEATTQARVSTVVSGADGGTGTAEQLANSLRGVDPARVGSVAADKAARSGNPRDLPPGRYAVILEPMAVETMLVFLSYIGFGGRAIAEGRSPLAGRHGEQVASPSVDIFDDALSPLTLGLPFDFEGTPKRRVPIIEGGVFATGVHDRRSARQAGAESTGHALPAPNPDGPFALNLFLQPGHTSERDMIAGTARGLLVTRFHYTNVVNPMETTITGMTRDGTWLIEDGEVAHPVKNLRFTQSILEALSNVEALGDHAVLAGEFSFAASRIPAAKIAGFNFSGASDH